MKKFIFVNLIFIIGMIILTLNHIHAWWVWAIYIAVWSISDSYFAKDFHLTWVQWVWIILGLSVLDIGILTVLS